MIAFGLVMVLVVLMLVESAFIRANRKKRWTAAFSSTCLFEQPDEWKGFNPLDRNTRLPTDAPQIGFDIAGLDVEIPESVQREEEARRSSSQSEASVTAVGIRSERMSRLTAKLANDSNDEDAMLKVLQGNRDFLLEQLEDPEAVLERGSIYTPDMDRSERYATYRSTMEERLSNASPVAKRVLTTMRDFVLSHE